MLPLTGVEWLMVGFISLFAVIALIVLLTGEEPRK